MKNIRKNNSTNTLLNDFLGKSIVKNTCYLYIALVINYEKITMICSSLSNLCTISICTRTSYTIPGQYFTNFLLARVPISLHCFLGNQPPVNLENSSIGIVQSIIGLPLTACTTCTIWMIIQLIVTRNCMSMPSLNFFDQEILNLSSNMCCDHLDLVNTSSTFYFGEPALKCIK